MATISQSGDIFPTAAGDVIEWYQGDSQIIRGPLDDNGDPYSPTQVDALGIVSTAGFFTASVTPALAISDPRLVPGQAPRRLDVTKYSDSSEMGILVPADLWPDPIEFNLEHGVPLVPIVIQFVSPAGGSARTILKLVIRPSELSFPSGD